MLADGSLPPATTSWPLLRQLFARLLSHHELGVPIWPVGVGFPCLRFMLPMRHRGASHRLGKVARRRIRRVACDTPTEPLRYFL